MSTVAYVITGKIKSRPELGAQGRHARGLGALSIERRREKDLTERCVTIDDQGQFKVHGVGSISLDVSADFDKHLAATGASCRKGAAIATHMIVGVTADWVKETGDPYDQNNPRVRALLMESRAWAEENLGGVFHCRYDIDENACAIVDVMAAPVRAHKKTGKLWVSTGKALAELADRYGQPESMSYRAVQDSWTEHAKKTLDPTMKRGEYVEESGRDHLSVDEYKRKQEAEKAVEAEKRGLEAREGAVTARERELQGLAEAAAEREAEALERVQEARARETKAAENESRVRAHVEAFRKEARAVLLQVGKRINQAGAEVKVSFLKLQAMAEDWHERSKRIGAAAEHSRGRARSRAIGNRAAELEREREASRRKERERDATDRGLDLGI